MLNLSKQLTLMGLAMPKEAQEKSLQFLRALEKWNQVYNLTAIRSFNDMVVYHLLDSLVIAPYVKKGDRLLDVGTGAGLPGFPLALYYPEKHFVLMDSNGKKVRFLQQIRSALDLTNVEIVHSRVENYQTNNGFDVIMSRAMKAVPEMIQMTQHLCCREGRFLAMKGTSPDAELQNLERPYLVEALRVPGLDAARHIVLVDLFNRR